MAQHKNGFEDIPESQSGIYAHVVGWGMSVPETILSNDDLAAIVETDDEWIRTRTGIRERRIANEDESSATLGYKAAQQALETADILPIDLDLIIVATCTPENFFPSTANLIQDWLGASKAGAFDISAACAGFVYAVNMGAQAIRSGSMKNVMVIGTETMSRVIDWQDRTTCILFGDGAGAVVLQASEEPGGILSSILRSDGAGYDALGIPTVGNRPINLNGNGNDDGNGHKLHKMHMAGREVFKFATRVVDESIRESAELANLEVDEIDLVIPHQANQRILASAAKKLKIDSDKFVSNLERYGNTSAASIPIALCEAIDEGRINEGDHIALVGFGGGLSWASMLIKWGIPEPEEQRGSRINRQRRRFFYTLSRWRQRARKWRRSLGYHFKRFQPNQGKIFRLRHKVDTHSEYF